MNIRTSPPSFSPNQHRSPSIRLSILAGLILLLFIAGCNIQPTPESTQVPAKDQELSLEAERESWISLSNLPPDATQIETGAEIYRLVCKSCHGDRGQGLTADWLAQWNPADQNCWQSKCHASNHPPDGFVLPRYIPGVIGPAITNRFETAYELQAYNKWTMPWHAPATMLDEEYWQVTAYILSINGVDLGGTVLDETNAASIRLP